MKDTKTGRGWRIVRRQPVPDTEPSHDPVFVRLIRDLQLAKRAQRKASKRAVAIELERGAFFHMCNYLDARAWCRTNDRDA
jgi:hypothetical protein